jgi:phage baseplate assembly protein W
MRDLFAHFGQDLRLLGDLQHQFDRNPGSDLFVTRRNPSGEKDLQVVRDAENLQQALLLRFLTRTGELTALGHPEYGSRLHTLIGERNDETNRNRAKLFVLEALAEEPRVKEVISVDVATNPAYRDEIDITVSLLAINSDTPVNLVFPFFLNGGSVS